MKIKYYIVLFIIFLPFSIFANSKISISINKGIIDTTVPKYNSNILFPGYIHNRFDLFKIDIPDYIEIIKHNSRTIINLDETINLDKKPEIFDFLINKIGLKKIKASIDNGLLHIIGDVNKTGSNYHKYSSDYYLANNEELFKGTYLDISQKFIVNSKVNANIKIDLNPFDKNVFLGYRIGAEPPYPMLSIFDNSLLPQDLKLILNDKIYYPESKYYIQRYKINMPYVIENDNSPKTKISYVFMPSYTFDIKLNNGENTLELSYKKFIGDSEEIIIQESY